MIGDTIAAADHQLIAIRLDRGDAIPDSTGFDGAIIMGGPQSANDESDYIRAELAWVHEALDAGMPILGICLGSQIMAKASGSQIGPSPVRELGWYPLYPTEASRHDPLFAGMPDGFGVFQWHGETFSIHDGMTLVATHPTVPAQAFRLGRAQYGLQFHVEVDEPIIESWIAFGGSERNHLGIEGIHLLYKETALHLASMQQFCREMTTRWLELI